MRGRAHSLLRTSAYASNERGNRPNASLGGGRLSATVSICFFEMTEERRRATLEVTLACRH